MQIFFIWSPFFAQTHFLNDPLSVVTDFHWWINSLFEWPFVRRHRFWLVTKLTFGMTLCPTLQILTGDQSHFLHNPLSVVADFDRWPNSFSIFEWSFVCRHRFWLMIKLTFWMTLCPSSQFLTNDQTHFLFFEWPFVRRDDSFWMMTKLIFHFLTDPLSVVTVFD